MIIHTITFKSWFSRIWTRINPPELTEEERRTGLWKLRGQRIKRSDFPLLWEAFDSLPKSPKRWWHFFWKPKPEFNLPDHKGKFFHSEDDC